MTGGVAFADDIDITGRTKQDVNAAFRAIERQYIKISLAAIEGKTKWSIGYHITEDNYTFRSRRGLVGSVLAY